MRPGRVLTAAAAGLCLWLGAVLARHGGNASVLCDFAGANLAKPDYAESARRHFRPGFHVAEEGTGYDGQYYFFVACDPFLTGAPGGYADPYYWQRILHPALAWVLALGEPARIPEAMAVVALGGVLLGTWALLGLSPAAGAWALAYAFAVGHLYGLRLSVGGPALSLGLSLAALLAWERGRIPACAGLLALALLARESAVLVGAVLGLLALGRRRWADAAWLALSLLPFLAWQVFLHQRLGEWAFGRSGGHLTLPFLGIFLRSMSLQGSGVDFAASPRGMLNNAVLVAFLAYGVATAVYAGRAWLRRRSLASSLLAVHAGFFLFLTSGQLVDLNGASRPFLPVTPFLVMMAAGEASEGGRWGRILLGVGLAFSLAVAAKTLL